MAVHTITQESLEELAMQEFLIDFRALVNHYRTVRGTFLQVLGRHRAARQAWAEKILGNAACDAEVRPFEWDMQVARELCLRGAKHLSNFGYERRGSTMVYLLERHSAYPRVRVPRTIKDAIALARALPCPIYNDILLRCMCRHRRRGKQSVSAPMAPEPGVGLLHESPEVAGGEPAIGLEPPLAAHA